MTGHLLYTEEDVELVRAALPIDPSDGTMPISWGSDGIPMWGQPDEVIARILAALSSSGRLVPPGSETEEQIGSRVWHADDPERATVDWTGRALAEERVRIHAEVLAADPAWRGRAEIVTRRQITTPWSVPDTEQEG